MNRDPLARGQPRLYYAGVPGSVRIIMNRRRLCLLLVTILLLTGAAMPATAKAAFADPASPDGNTSTQAQLDGLVRAYNDAKGRLDAAKQHEADLTTQAKVTADALAALTPEATAIAVTAYKGGRLADVAALLDSDTPDGLLERAGTLHLQLDHDNRTLRRLSDTQAQYTEQLAAIDQQVQAQQAELAAMDKRKGDLEKLLAGNKPAAGITAAGSAASPAPRNSDGSWPKESCSVADPTTSGCLTPRTLHALQEARKAGFTHYTACYRKESSGEHPLGRACDFSANASTFVNAAATGADKAYGDRLAAWFLANADRLAVLYVIWYRQIWLPGIGWRAYHGDGTPAGDHMNHVHLSVQ